MYINEGEKNDNNDAQEATSLMQHRAIGREPVRMKYRKKSAEDERRLVKGRCLRVACYLTLINDVL